jgi:hypothetical protein
MDDTLSFPCGIYMQMLKDSVASVAESFVCFVMPIETVECATRAKQ